MYRSFAFNSEGEIAAWKSGLKIIDRLSPRRRHRLSSERTCSTSRPTHTRRATDGRATCLPRCSQRTRREALPRNNNSSNSSSLGSTSSLNRAADLVGRRSSTLDTHRTQPCTFSSSSSSRVATPLDRIQVRHECVFAIRLHHRRLPRADDVTHDRDAMAANRIRRRAAVRTAYVALLTLSCIDAQVTDGLTTDVCDAAPGGVQQQTPRSNSGIAQSLAHQQPPFGQQPPGTRALLLLPARCSSSL